MRLKELIPKAFTASCDKVFRTGHTLLAKLNLWTSSRQFYGGLGAMPQWDSGAKPWLGSGGQSPPDSGEDFAQLLNLFLELAQQLVYVYVRSVRSNLYMLSTRTEIPFLA